MDGNNVLTMLHTNTELRTSSQFSPAAAMFIVYNAIRKRRKLGLSGSRGEEKPEVATVLPVK